MEGALVGRGRSRARGPYANRSAEWGCFLTLPLVLRTKARYRGGVAPKSHASVRTVRFILEAPHLGGSTGAWPHLGSPAYQAQGSNKL